MFAYFLKYLGGCLNLNYLRDLVCFTAKIPLKIFSYSLLYIEDFGFLMKTYYIVEKQDI